MLATQRYRLFAITLATFALSSLAPSALAEYNPKLGRFMQRDPNATGIGTLQDAAHNGQPLARIVTTEAGVQYMDGMQAYGYLRDAPTQSVDALGLWLDGRAHYLSAGPGARMDYLAGRLNNPDDSWYKGMYGRERRGEDRQELARLRYLGSLVPLGHSDFEGWPTFDWVRFDHQLFTNPANPINYFPLFGTKDHFRPLEDVERELIPAVDACNKEDFEDLGHQGQDYFSHRIHGFTWWTAGHLAAGSLPDNSFIFDFYWVDAQTWTEKQVAFWYKYCERKDDGTWRRVYYRPYPTQLDGSPCPRVPPGMVW